MPSGYKSPRRVPLLNKMFFGDSAPTTKRKREEKVRKHASLKCRHAVARRGK